jgi:hypothetical protein
MIAPPIPIQVQEKQDTIPTTEPILLLMGGPTNEGANEGETNGNDTNGNSSSIMPYSSLSPSPGVSDVEDVDGENRHSRFYSSTELNKIFPMREEMLHNIPSENENSMRSFILLTDSQSSQNESENSPQEQE